MSGLYVTFTGADGAGKTTQATRLHRRLRANGIDSYLVDKREDFSFEVLRTIGRRHVPGHNKAHRVLFGNEPIEIVLALDSLREQYEAVTPMMTAGRTVIYSRSVHTRIAWAEVQGSSNVEEVRVILSYAPKPHINIWLDVPVPILIRRLENRGLDREDAADLERFTSIMPRLAAAGQWLRVDGGTSEEDVHERIWRHVRSRVNRQRRVD